MDFTSFFQVFFGFVFGILELIRSYTFNAFGFSFSYFDIVFACLITGMIITAFWKGARA